MCLGGPNLAGKVGWVVIFIHCLIESCCNLFQDNIDVLICYAIYAYVSLSFVDTLNA
jgi:hypothetical protein